jgi:hypothetical protein
VIKTCYNNGQKEGSENGRVVTIGMFAIFRKAPPSVVSGYGKRSINLNKVVANWQKILAAAPLRVMASRYNPCE